MHQRNLLHCDDAQSFDGEFAFLLMPIGQCVPSKVDESVTVSLRCLAGCLHPDHEGFFESPAQYLKWYGRRGPVQDAAAPTVAVLLYRKHVITQQLYIEQLVRCLEAKGVRPLPIFINGAALLSLHSVCSLRLSAASVVAAASVWPPPSGGCILMLCNLWNTR